MLKKILLFFCLALPGLAFAKEECEEPTAPAIPSGRTSTAKEMREAMQAVQDFVIAGVAYRECLDKMVSGVEDRLPERARTLFEEAYQDSLELDDLVAETFNTQVRIFKSLND